MALANGRGHGPNCVFGYSNRAARRSGIRQQIISPRHALVLMWAGLTGKKIK